MSFKSTIISHIHLLIIETIFHVIGLSFIINIAPTTNKAEHFMHLWGKFIYFLQIVMHMLQPRQSFLETRFLSKVRPTVFLRVNMFDDTTVSK